MRLCEAYKHQYITLRDAAKLENPDKVRPEFCNACWVLVPALPQLEWGMLVGPAQVQGSSCYLHAVGRLVIL